MLPLIGAGLSVIGGIAGNAQASANAKAQAKNLWTNYQIGVESLNSTANEINKQVGMELTKNKFKAVENKAAVTGALAETGIAGQTAARVINDAEIKEMMNANSIKQYAEAKIGEIQSEMLNAKYTYESGVMNTAINQANATKSPFELIGMGVQGAIAGAQLSSSLSSLPSSGISPGHLGSDDLY